MSSWPTPIIYYYWKVKLPLNSEYSISPEHQKEKSFVLWRKFQWDSGIESVKKKIDPLRKKVFKNLKIIFKFVKNINVLSFKGTALITQSFLLFTTLSLMTQIALTGKWTARSLLPGASIPIFTWANPVPYLFILRTEICGGGGGSLVSREKTLTFRAFRHYWNIFVRPACDVNNRWPQLSYYVNTREKPRGRCS